MAKKIVDEERLAEYDAEIKNYIAKVKSSEITVAKISAYKHEIEVEVNGEETDKS